MNISILTTILLLTDLISKQIMTYFFPQLVIYNQNLAFGIEASSIVKFGTPLIGLLISIYTIRLISSQNAQKWAMGLVLASFLGNYIGRFNDQGVVDFINFGYCVANLADVFGWISGLIVAINLIKEFKKA